MELREAMRGRRSVRRFDDRVIDPAIIREILEEAAWAPSGGNLQPWKVAVLGREAVRRYLAEREDAAVDLLAMMMKIAVAEQAAKAGQPLPPGLDDRVLEGMVPMVRMAGAPPSHLVVLYYERPTLPRLLRTVATSARLGWHAFWKRPGLGAKLSYAWLLASRFGRLLHMDRAAKIMGLSNYTYALTLAAYERGIDSCIQCHFASDPGGLRRLLELDSRHDILGCVVLGYPCPAQGAEAGKPVSTARDPVPTRWID